MSKSRDTGGIQVKATNRKALHDFIIEERFEVGMVLVGSEIKSVRAGKASMRDSYALVEGGEVFLYEMNISALPQAGHFGHDPRRPRKLLLHRDEIKRLAGKITEKGYTLVPLKLYIKDGKAKLELGLAHGKRLYDRRRDIAMRDAQRDMEREVRQKTKGPGGGQK